MEPRVAERRDQRLFARLAVFAGGIDLEAAGAVYTIGAEPAPDVLDGLSSLVDNSLLRPSDVDTDEPRFGMLETLREYALQELRARGEHDAARRAHAAWHLDLVERAEPHVAVGPDQRRWIERLEREHDNVRAALAWTGDANEPGLALRLAAAMARFWQLRGHSDEGRRWLADAIRDAPAAAPAIRARAFTGAATLARVQGDYGSGLALLEAALGAYRDAGDRKGIGHTYSSLGAVALDRGDLERARGLQEDAVALLRELGDEHQLAGALDNLADLALNTGDFARAGESPPRRSRSIAGEARRTEPRSRCSTRRSPRCTTTGTMRRARSSRRASPARRPLGDLEGVIYCLEAFAALAQRRGDAEQAARLLGTTEVLAHEQRVTLTPFERELHTRTGHQLAAARSSEQLRARASGDETDVGRRSSTRSRADAATSGREIGRSAGRPVQVRAHALEQGDEPAALGGAEAAQRLLGDAVEQVRDGLGRLMALGREHDAHPPAVRRIGRPGEQARGLHPLGHPDRGRHLDAHPARQLARGQRTPRRAAPPGGSSAPGGRRGRAACPSPPP